MIIETVENHNSVIYKISTLGSLANTTAKCVFVCVVIVKVCIITTMAVKRKERERESSYVIIMKRKKWLKQVPVS